MTDEAALLKAITADAGDDTPRLAYADWLDEHDAPLQAEFIRLQCRLAAGSAADPDYPDLTERYAEVAAQFAFAARLTVPPLPPGFTPDTFRRGFLYTAAAEWADPPWYHRAPPTDAQLERICAGLADLVATTTVRRLTVPETPPDALARVLAAPGAELLTGLNLQPHGGATNDAVAGVVAQSPIVAGLERLEFSCDVPAAGLLALAAAPLPRLRALDFPVRLGAAPELDSVARAGWFGGLREANVWGVERPLHEPLIAALAALPRLESLDLRAFSSEMPVPAARGGFPALARLALNGDPPAPLAVARLAAGRFPRLAELVLPRLSDESLAPLFGAAWLPQLRTLDVSGGGLTGRAVAALARSAAASGLRALKVGLNPLGAAGLAAIADGTRFPNLTTLVAYTNEPRVRPATAERFAAALSLPRVRHLYLGGWPLGDAGAKALARNPHLAGVTRLSLPNCGIGDRGFGALARSPYLQGLIELDLGNNTLKKAAPLLDPDLLPRLAAAGLGGNPLAPAARERLRRARGWLV